LILFADVAHGRAHYPAHELLFRERKIRYRLSMGAKWAVPSVGTSAAEQALIERLCAGDEASFVALINRYHGALVRVAMIHTGDRSVAEEVVQETWLGVIEGIKIFRILLNQARKRGARESRSIPVSAMSDGERASEGPAVDEHRFLPADHPIEPGHWAIAPTSWGPNPEQRLLMTETLTHIQSALEALPKSQREVMTLRDVSGWSSAEVCELLGISEPNQRVLLHRARSKVRRGLERYFDGKGIYAQ
jgi:RNA polymerase sigma-70 factor (ECF subfamily)